MANLMTQVRELSPSAREPLFRRLMVDESLAYLRDKNSIIGFELDMSVDQSLSGFSLIGIQKHTIYAFVSDLKETPRLILFPPLDKLFDSAFELLDLHVIKKQFVSAKFEGKELTRGPLQELVRDLTPPEKEVDISKQVAEQMAKQMKQADAPKPVQSEALKTSVKPTAKPAAVDPEPVMEESFVDEPLMDEPPVEMDLNAGFMDEDPGYDMYEGNFDSYASGYDSYDSGYAYDTDIEMDEEPVEEPVIEPEPTPAEDPRTLRLREQSFQSLSEVSDFCSGVLGVQRPLAVNVVNKALQSNVAPEYRIELAIKLFSKLFNEKKI